LNEFIPQLFEIFFGLDMLIDLKNLCSKLQVSVRGFKYVFLGLVTGVTWNASVPVEPDASEASPCWLLTNDAL